MRASLGIVGAVVLGLALGLCPAALAQEVMQVVQNMPGIKPETFYKDFGRGEMVNPANGGLTVMHPSSVSLPQNMGAALQPVRVYNSKNPEAAWGYSTDETDLPYGFLGFGWTLSYGRIFVRPAPHAKYNVTPQSYETRAFYFYQDETGAEHRLYKDTTVENLNLTNPFPQSTSWYFTCDGSYIRAKYTYASTGGTWVIYYPDGSTRSAGGASGSSYIAATPGPQIPNGDGTYYVNHLRNPHVCGWYVTQITDRSGNGISISYRTYDSSTQPFGGSISSVTDQLSRAITFATDPTTHFLTSISGGGMSESYSVGSDSSQVFFYHGSLVELPALRSVTDAADAQTLYRYAKDTVTPGANEAHLTKIYYPTGAVSQYVFNQYTFTFCQFPANPNYSDCGSAEGDEVVKHQLWTRPAGTSAWTALTWTYHRYTPGYYLGRTSQTQPVRIADPLGGYVVHFFSFNDAPNSGEIRPGREVAVLRYRSGAACSYSPSTPEYDRIFATNRYWAFGDRLSGGTLYGDVQRCLEDGATAPQMAEYGNPRVWKTVEKEYPASGGSTENWSRETWSSGWDGFGHYLVTETTGTSVSGTRITAVNYDLKKDLSTTTYQLDRLTLSYSGGMSGQGLAAGVGIYLLPPGEDPPEPDSLYATGEFKVVKNTYETTSRGLLTKRTDFAAKATSFSFLYGSLYLSPAPTVGAADRSMEVASYTSQGNIARIKYYLGSGTGTLTANFSWSYGMVSQMWWDYPTFHYYEIQRNILSTNSRIDYETDPNGFKTKFTYDSPGRVTKIEHWDSANAAIEYAEQAAYPNDSTTFSDTESWTTAHKIKVYKGAQGSIPAILPGPDPVSNWTTDTLTCYSFDDLGRLVTTQSVVRGADASGGSAGAYWSQRETRYDALGRPVFASEPFFIYEGLLSTTYNQPMQLWNESDCSTSSPSYPVTVPMKSAVPFGTWDTVYGSAGQTAPFSGTIETFYRTSRMVKPDGALVVKGYNGLTETTTVKVMGSDSTTTYTKNVIGWLLSVSPPAGAAAAYGYDGLGNLATVSLNSGGQTRSFTYDAMGHVTAFTQPEQGSWSFTYGSIGNVTAYTDGQSQSFTNSYDWKGRLLTTVRTSSTPSFTVLANTYDGAGGTPAVPSEGKLVQSAGYQADVLGTTQTTTLAFSYLSGNGRLWTVGQTVSAYGATPPTISITLAYTMMGQVLTQTLPSSTTITNSYTAGMLAGEGFSATPEVNALIYNPAGALRQIVFNNTMKELADYDALSRPKGYRFERSGAVIWTNGSYAGASYPYTYDGAGNVLSIGNMASPSSPDTFTYDPASRLTAATVRKSASTPAHAYAYQYDAYGNLTGRAESRQTSADLKTYIRDVCGADDSTATDYARNLCFTSTVASGGQGVSNQLYQVTRGGTLSVGGQNYLTGVTTSTVTFGHSGNGNVTDDGTYTYTYDPLNRLVAVRLKLTNQLQTEYFYDAAGERAATIQYTGGSKSAYTQYLRDGSRVVYEKTWALPGYTVSSEKYYLYVQGKMAVTKQVVSGTTTYTYYGTDHLGTVRATATFTSGGTYQGYTLQDYEPCGMEIPPRDTTSPNAHKYTGHERDVLNATPGTYYTSDYMHFRFYGSNMGRFMKPDNISGNMANPQSWNLYSYVHGNPVKFNDPTGHAAMSPGNSLQYLMGFKVNQDVDENDVAFSLGVHLSLYFAKANPDPVKWAGPPTIGRTAVVYYTTTTARVAGDIYNRLIKAGWKPEQIKTVPTVSESDLAVQTRSNSSASASFFVYHHYEGSGFQMGASQSPEQRNLVSDEAFAGSLPSSLHGRMAFVGCFTLRPASLAASEDLSESRTAWGSTGLFYESSLLASSGAVEYGWH